MSEEISVEIDGKSCSGQVEVSRGLVTVRTPYSEKTTQIGVPAEEDNWFKKEAAELGPHMSRSVEEALNRWGKRRTPFSVKITKTEDGSRTLSTEPDFGGKDGHAFRKMDAFGTKSSVFAAESMGWLAAVARQRGNSLPTERELNAALAVVDGMRPEGEIEAMLTVQMYAAYEVATEMMVRAKQATSVEDMQNSSTIATKMMRTYTTQVEALNKLRRGGEQTVRVEHVHVHSGGQAIVGNVTKPDREGEGMTEKAIDPTHPSIRMALPLFAAPRCLARTRSGAPCQSPRVRGRSRCRMHGGAKGSGGPKGRRHGRYQNGQFTCEAVEERRRTRALIAQMRAFVEDLWGAKAGCG